MTESARELRLGDVLDGKYRLVSLLGAGGMGAVFAALRLTLGDTVAVKGLLPIHDDEVGRARFLREAKAAARITHPSVVRVFDYGDAEGRSPYIVMELIDGPTLGAELRCRGPLPVDRALAIFGDVCAAVEAGHRRGVIHRDLKPANIMLARTDDGGEVIKVLDFGIATGAGLAEASTLTEPGDVVGTLSYMAPEQACGAEVGPESDVYSLGVILYEMLTGKHPSASEKPLERIARSLTGERTPIAAHLPTLPPHLAAAVDRALSPDRSARHSTPEAFARAAGLHAASTAPTPTPEPHVAASADLSSPDLERHFVGREQELARIEEQRRGARSGSGRLTVILGDPGVGKSALVHAFARRASDAGDSVLWARFSGYEGSRLPAFDAILRMCTDGRTVTGDARPHADVELGDADKWQRFTSIASALSESASIAPLVLAFDDLQWASADELELIAYLQHTLDPRRAFLVATARSPEGESELGPWLATLGSRRACAVVELLPLSSEHVREWLLGAFGALRIRPQDHRRIEQVTGNNPHYILELMRHLLTIGAIRHDEHGGGAFRCDDLTGVTLPESMIGVVRASLASLSGRLREVLEIAAVIGYQQRFGTLQAATGLTEGELETAVDEAIGLRILTDAGVSRNEDLRFASETLRRVLYDEMTARRRRRAHERVASTLRALYANDHKRTPRILCYHHHAICDWSDALASGLTAVENDLALHAHDEAEASLQRAREAARELSEAGTPPAADVLARLDALTGALYARLGRHGEALDLLARAATHAELTVERRIDALHDVVRCHIGLGDLERALTSARLARDRAASTGDAARILASHTLEADCLSRLGRNIEADRLLAPALEAAGTDVALSARSQAVRQLAFTAVKCGAFAEGEALGRTALALARAAGDPIRESEALSAVAAAFDEGGDPASAIPFRREALKLARAFSLRRREAIELANAGEGYATLGQLALAEQHFRAGLVIFMEIEDRACEGDCRVNVGRALLAREDYGEAIAMLQHGLKICEATGRAEYAAIALASLGEARYALDDLAQAEEALAEARRRFENQASHYVWRASLGLARVAKKRGDSASLRRYAEDARARLLAQRATLPPRASPGALDATLAEIDGLLRG